MTDAPHPALLPTGMHDLLPPEAEIEAQVVAQLMTTFAAHGYERVKPPLVEFEDTLFSGAGAAMATATFRMMDPASHRMIGVRADMTPQIARIAATRLGDTAGQAVARRLLAQSCARLADRRASTNRPIESLLSKVVRYPERLCRSRAPSDGRWRVRARPSNTYSPHTSGPLSQPSQDS